MPRAPDPEATTNGAPLAYFWGDDVLALRRAVERLARNLGPAGEPLQVWRAEGSAATGLDELALRLGTAPLFGGGLLAVVTDPLALLRSKADRERTVALIERVAAGNAIAFTELLGTGAREPAAASAALREAIARAGGHVQRLQAPRSGQLAAWIADRAAELGIRIEPPAVKLLAERLGGGVREGDADRRYQTELAEAQLELLALYRPAGPVRRVDVEALVAPAVPASAWAFLDAVATRHVREATALATRLAAEGTPLQVTVTQLHRRLRQLLELRARMAGGAARRDLVRELRLNPYRAEILFRQAMAWEPTELQTALEALLEVDLASKGLAADARHGAGGMSGPLALALWLSEQVPPR